MDFYFTKTQTKEYVELIRRKLKIYKISDAKTKVRDRLKTGAL